MKLSRPDILAYIKGIVWRLFLLFLPVTSFKYFPEGFGGGTLVRPLSVYPLVFLLILVVIPRLWKPIPKTILALAPFILAAFTSSLLSLLSGIEPSLGVTVFDRVLRALVTLMIGVAIYLAVALTPRTTEDLRMSLRWVYAGFTLAYAWGTAQMIFVLHYNHTYFSLLNRIQRSFSMRKLFPTRISGLTYEPNWFAEQICFFMLPWLLAAVLNGYSVFNWRWRKITVEWLLLGWSVILMVFTFSRAGLANLLILTVLTLLIYQSNVLSGKKQSISRLRNWFIGITEATLAVVVLVGGIYYAGTKNEFFARMWKYWIDNEKPTLSRYVEYIGFGARIAYSEAALNTYAVAPILGVGLGNYAFYFEEMIPDQPLARTPELMRIISPEDGRDRLITVKNFYLRLMSETGLVGLATFSAFLIAIAGCTLYLWLSHDTQHKFWGTGGVLGIIVFIISAFTFDSFTLPNMWVLFGLITASAWIISKQVEQIADNAS